MPDSCYRHHLHGSGVVWSTATGRAVLHSSHVWPSRGAEDGCEVSNTLGFATEIHPETSNELFLSYRRVSDDRGLCRFFLRNRNTGVNLKPWVLSLSKREQWWHCWSRIFGSVIPLRNFTRWVGLAISLRVLAGCHTEFPSVSKIRRGCFCGRILLYPHHLLSPPSYTQPHPLDSESPCFLWTVPFEVKFFHFFILWESFFQTLTFLKAVEEV